LGDTGDCRVNDWKHHHCVRVVIDTLVKLKITSNNYLILVETELQVGEYK